MTHFDELRRQAATRRWYLAVQRDVNSLYDSDSLDQRYPTPGPLDERSA